MVHFKSFIPNSVGIGVNDFFTFVFHPSVLSACPWNSLWGRAPQGLLCCGDTFYELKNSLSTFPHLDLILPLAPLSTPSARTLEHLPASIPAPIPCTSQSHIWSTCLLHPCPNSLYLSAPHQPRLWSTCLLPSLPQFPVPLTPLHLEYLLSSISPPFPTLTSLPHISPALEYLPVSTLAPVPCTSQLHISPAIGVPACFHPCPSPCISQPSIWSTCLLPSLPSSLHLLLCPTSARPLEYLPASFSPQFPTLTSVPHISPAFGVPACFRLSPVPYTCLLYTSDAADES